MNSLNILSARVSPPPSPTTSRSNSYGNLLSAGTVPESRRGPREGAIEDEKDGSIKDENAEEIEGAPREEIAMLRKDALAPINAGSLGWNIITRLSTSLFDSIRWVLSTLAAPGVYLIACLYDERGKFAPFSQIWKVLSGGSRRASTSQALGMSSLDSEDSFGVFNDKSTVQRRGSTKALRARNTSSSSSGLSSESESERDRPSNEGEKSTNPSRHLRSKSTQSSDDISPARRSIRIKLSTEGNLRQRKRKGQASSAQSDGAGGISPSEISAASLKSPTSPASSLSMTKYPRAPAPPRPLIPRRQPSYTLPETPAHTQKTLIIDLDETLIHSMSRGGRMGTGHAVEVNLNTSGVPTAEHHILYYVYKRPYCDEFLRRVCKWYNLVIFTASVQEYADPVIDWLEQERAFIKDVTSIEPDLSKVMILDNSPLSYLFHQDNAIPIQGWTSDPTDSHLLHLVPLLEGLQYVTDVRAFLALRGGEDGKYTS